MGSTVIPEIAAIPPLVGTVFCTGYGTAPYEVVDQYSVPLVVVDADEGALFDDGSRIYGQLHFSANHAGSWTLSLRHYNEVQYDHPLVGRSPDPREVAGLQVALTEGVNDLDRALTSVA